ncbi:MAG: type VI secretion system baseplate subunit TssG [Planctomycetes bacterium]|nr:type VI secretion system baseplate subunit TssG [Planctomycetota bacterium]
MKKTNMSPEEVRALLHRALSALPYRFDFFQALRRLECAQTEKPRIGASIKAADDPVRLGQEPSMAFAPSTLASFTLRGPLPPLLKVYFLGLFGPNGPLPLHLTEYAHDRSRNAGDRTFERFADMFHHRLLSQFYRSWAVAQPAVSYDRPQQDRFGEFVASLFGLGMPSLRNRDAFPDAAKLHFAGRLVCQTRHPEGLAAILREFFRVPVRIVEFIGQWIRLPPDAICRLGESPATGTIGQTAIVGSRIWESHHKFRIVIGPMGFADFIRLLPGGSSIVRLVALVRNYVGDELEWDVNLILEKEEVPDTSLGFQGRLGWTTWIKSKPLPKDADDLYLTPLEHVA